MAPDLDASPRRITSNADCFSVSNGTASALAASPSKESGRVCTRSGPKAVAFALNDGRTRWEVSSAVDASPSEKKVRLVPPAGGVGPDHFAARPEAALAPPDGCARARKPMAFSAEVRRRRRRRRGGGGARPEDCSAAAQLETFAFLLRGAGFAFASEGSLWLQGFGQRPGLRAVRDASSRGMRRVAPSPDPRASRAAGAARPASGRGAGALRRRPQRPAAGASSRPFRPRSLEPARAPGELVAGSFGSERVATLAPPSGPRDRPRLYPSATSRRRPPRAHNEARGKAPAKSAKAVPRHDAAPLRREEPRDEEQEGI
eukprot:tig00000189_g14326.t1